MLLTYLGGMYVHTGVKMTRLSTSASAVAASSLSHSLPLSVTAPSLCSQSRPLPDAATAPRYSTMSPHTPASQAPSTVPIRVLETGIVGKGTTFMPIQAACPTWHRTTLAATPIKHRSGPPQQPTTSLDTPAMRIHTPMEATRMRMRQRVTIV